jgi:membrane protein required for beta-lactamase induction
MEDNPSYPRQRTILLWWLKGIWYSLCRLGVFLLYGCLIAGGLEFIRDGLFPELLYATSPEDYEVNINAYVALFLFGIIGISIRSYIRGKRKLNAGR